MWYSYIAYIDQPQIDARDHVVDQADPDHRGIPGVGDLAAELVAGLAIGGGELGFLTPDGPGTSEYILILIT